MNMNIERLKELKQQIKGVHDGINGDDLNLLYDLLPLVDAAIARQSVKSEEVQEAIEDLTTLSNMWQEIGQPTKEIDLAITALQQYQPWVSVSERLPEEGEIVMVAYGEAIYFASIQYWGIRGKEVPVWRVGMGHRIEKDFSETHWKPYPETPKGE